MTLLSVVQTAAGEVGLPIPSLVVGNGDSNVTQMLYLANRSGKELAEDTDSAGYWQYLRKQYTFQTVGYGPYTCTITPSSTTLTNVSSFTGVAVGQSVYASGLVNDTLVTAFNAGAGTVTISQAPTSTVALSGQSVVFAQEAYPLPSDLAYWINQTVWDRTFRWQLLGPLDAQEWQVIKSGISPVGPRMRWRVMQGQFYINPVGSSSSVYTDTIVYEYVTNQWVAVTTAPTVCAQTLYMADTDISLIPEDLIILSVKWRFLRSKGLSYDDEYEQYVAKLSRYRGRDAMARNLPINARASGIRLLNSQNVPDTGFGS